MPKATKPTKARASAAKKTKKKVAPVAAKASKTSKVSKSAKTVKTVKAGKSSKAVKARRSSAEASLNSPGNPVIKDDGKGTPPSKRKLGLRGAAPWAARHAAKHAAEARARAAEPAPPGSARATIRVPDGAEAIKAKIRMDLEEFVAAFCAALPEEIERAEKVTVRATGLDGRVFELKAEGLLAIAVQHEYDHLDGTLMVDRVSLLKRRMIDRDMKKRALQDARP